MITVMVADDNIELLQFIQRFLFCHIFWCCFPCLKFVGTRSRSKKILVLPWMRAHINVNHILLEHLDPRLGLYEILGNSVFMQLDQGHDEIENYTSTNLRNFFSSINFGV